LARIDIFSRLINARVIVARIERSRMMLTKRSTPIPEKTTFADGNAWRIMIRSQILGIGSIKTDDTNTLTESG
jgi:hypothetical protein